MANLDKNFGLYNNVDKKRRNCLSTAPIRGVFAMSQGPHTLNPARNVLYVTIVLVQMRFSWDGSAIRFLLQGGLSMCLVG